MKVGQAKATTDDRIAKVINVTMFTALLLAMFGFAVWNFGTEFNAVRDIYAGLGPEQQDHVEQFGRSLGLLVAVFGLGAGLLGRLVSDWRHRATERAS